MTPTVNHHTTVRYCRTCGRWHCRCDGCSWIWYSACSFTEALRHTTLHQLDRIYLESQRADRLVGVEVGPHSRRTSAR